MRSLASMCAVVLVVSTASAGIDLFLTRGPAGGGVPGMKEPDTFNTAEKDFRPNYEPWQGNPARSPFVQELQKTDVYFLWMEGALGPNEVFAQVYGIDFRGSRVTGGMVREDGLFYRHKTGSSKRWDSAGKIEFPGLAAAVTGRGLEIPVGPNDLGNEYQGKSYILLGAIRLRGDGYPGAFQLGLGPATFAVRITDDQGNTRDYDGTANNRYPGLTIQGKNAYQGPYDSVVLIPEPASALLLALVSVALRRR